MVQRKMSASWLGPMDSGGEDALVNSRVQRLIGLVIGSTHQKPVQPHRKKREEDRDEGWGGGEKRERERMGGRWKEGVTMRSVR